MPSAKYFKEHPDWYSEIKGKRTEKSQLCCTNDEMIAELSRNVLERIRKNPDAGIISVAQNDSGRGYCECARCKASDDAEGSHSASLRYCVNKVAEAVEEEYPDFWVETLA